jgi:hypothetical protein
MKLTPLPNESAEAYLARQAIEDCATKYIATVGEAALTGRMKDSRENGAKAVFDLNAPHANGVLDAVAAKTGKSRSLLIVQDILACELLETQTGVQPDSPVPADKMTLVPSDPAAYVAHLTALRAAKAGLAALGYAVVDL